MARFLNESSRARKPARTRSSRAGSISTPKQNHLTCLSTSQFQVVHKVPDAVLYPCYIAALRDVLVRDSECNMLVSSINFQISCTITYVSIFSGFLLYSIISVDTLLEAPITQKNQRRCSLARRGRSATQGRTVRDLA
jgi:hypothetical protein